MGLELTMNSAAALYFTDEFGQTTASAAAIASVYGWVAPIGTFLGGHLSDVCNRHYGLHGRLLVQFFGCITMGGFVLIFAQLHTMNSSIGFLALTSIAQKAAVSFTFSIVPYVDPPRTGTIAGIVASGAGFGAICFGLVFRQIESYETAFLVIGLISVAVSFLTFFINIPGQEHLWSFRCQKRKPTLNTSMKHELEFPSDLPEVEDDVDDVNDVNEHTTRSKSTVQFDLSTRDEGATHEPLPFGKMEDDGSTGDSASTSCEGLGCPPATNEIGKSEHSDSSFDSSKISVNVDNEDEFEVSTLVEI